MKVALVYDRVNKWGGAERVVIALRKIFPSSVLYTSVYEKSRASWAKKIEVIPSFLQKIPYASRFHEALGTFMPIAFESFNFDGYDLVVSVTSEAAKGIITKPSTRHISIILTPTRYLWSGYDEYFANPLLRIAAWPVVVYLRAWDRIAAHRPDRIIAISSTVERRINKYYGLSSEIIFPPLMIRANRLKTGKIGNRKYYLCVSRLVPYKRIDLAVQAANRLKLPLKIIGTGSEYARLKKMAGPTIEFIKSVTDAALKDYYANCEALIFPGNEDFGLTMAEVQLFGRPVVAFRKGGAEEIVIEGKTGVFFDKQTVSSLTDVLKKFKPSRYNSLDCIRNSKRFTYEKFRNEMLKVINS